MPACSIARRTTRGVAWSIGPRRPNPSSSARRSVPMIPWSSGLPGVPRSVTRFSVPGSRAGRCLTPERKMSGSTQGVTRIAPRPANASWRRSTEAKRFALLLASGKGLSAVRGRPSVVQVQLWPSPRRVPGRDLTSMRTSPAGVRTRASTSLTRPSSSMNSKFDHACHGSLSGNRSRRKSSASRSPFERRLAYCGPAGRTHGPLSSPWRGNGWGTYHNGSHVVTRFRASQ